MRVPDDILARLCIAYRERREITLTWDGVQLMTRTAGPPRKQPMVYGYYRDLGYMTEHQWSNTLEDFLWSLGRLR